MFFFFLVFNINLMIFYILFNFYFQVSMMVHRVENTLLIDEYDIAKLFLQASDWTWLNKFVYDHVMENLNLKVIV